MFLCETLIEKTCGAPSFAVFAKAGPHIVRVPVLIQQPTAIPASTRLTLLPSSRFPSARLPLSTISLAHLFCLLDVVGLDDGGDQPRKAFVYFRAA
jgi:hypothetical protein